MSDLDVHLEDANVKAYIKLADTVSMKQYAISIA